MGRGVRIGVPALVLLGAFGCARQSAPPGGPPDFTPPAVVEVTPAPRSTVEPGGDPVVVRFSERISERVSTGAAETSVEVSPVTGDVRVRFGRDRIEVSLQGGFQSGVVYRVRVLPVVNDMFGNQMREPFETVFSTGPALNPSVVAGTVVNRLTLTPSTDVKVIAVPEPAVGGLFHVASADVEGIFALRYLPMGSYTVTAFQDVNRNLEVDPFEARAVLPAELALGDTVLLEFRTLVPDTTPAILVDAEVEDSVELRLSFDDFIDPDLDLGGLEITFTDSLGTGGPAPEVGRILHDHELSLFRMARMDSLLAVTRAEAAAEAAAADSAGAAPDTVPEAMPPACREQAPAQQRDQDQEGAGVRESREPLPSQDLIVIFHDPPLPGSEWWVRVGGLENIGGVPGGGGSRSFLVPVPDTTAVEGDSISADTLPADTIPRDTIPAPRSPDGVVLPPARR